MRQTGQSNSGLSPPYTAGASADDRADQDPPSLKRVCFETGMTLSTALAIVLIVQLLLILG